jgi:nucleotide-binding universal stress UspA family protein
MLHIRTILHPTDFSVHSDAAFQMAFSLAKDYRARLVVVHVAEPPLPVYPAGGLIIPRPDTSSIDAAGERLRAIRPPSNAIVLEHRLVEGNPGVEILRMARELKPDLILLGTHGRTGLGRLLMGSVAEEVLRKASCPVLTVKTPLGASPERAAAAPVPDVASVP